MRSLPLWYCGPALAAFLSAGIVTGCGGSNDPGRDLPDADGHDAGDAFLDGGEDTDSGVPPDVAPDVGEETGGDGGGPPDTDTDAEDPVELRVALTAPAEAWVGEELVLDARASTGVAQWTWDYGDGVREVREGLEGGLARYAWEAPGRYRVALTGRSSVGQRRTVEQVISVVERPVFDPAASSTIVSTGARSFAVVCTDAGTVTTFTLEEDGRPVRDAVIDVCSTPRSVAVVGDSLVVTCQDVDEVAMIPRAGGDVRRVSLRWGARPFGVVPLDGTRAAVTLQGTGQVAVLDLPTSTWERFVDVGPDPRGLARLPDGGLLVSRWRSPDDQGEVERVGFEGSRRTIPLAFDPQLASDTEAGGIPSYLGAAAVPADGAVAWVPGTQVNLRQGLRLNGEALTFETTLRAVASSIDLTSERELFDQRKQFNDRGLASAAAFSPRGDFLYLTMRGAQTVERLDRFTGLASGSFQGTGFAPEGLAFTPDGRFLVVDASLSREVVVLRIDAWSTDEALAGRMRVVDEEPLDAVVLRGKQLFNDARDVRLAKDSYIACSHCHLDGESDHRTWDFSDRGEGLRNTTSLLGRAGLGHGPVHWSANFDELQDFEIDIRGPFGGHGLLTPEDWEATGEDDPFGPPRAGRSEDLDALAVYLESLDTWPRSPHRAPDGSLTEAAERGRAIFAREALGCTGCHTGEALTDSAFLAPGVPRLHDVGSLTEASGERLGGPLEGIDTPTLFELFNSAPYLHDGSAPTLADVFVRLNDGRHGAVADLSDEERNDLIAWLLSLDAAGQ